MHDHIAVERIEFHEVRLAIRLLRGDQRAAGAAEQVEHILPFAGGELHRPRRQFHRLLGEMHHVLRVDLFHLPQVAGVVGAEKESPSGEPQVLLAG
jgi:hypothetical protein